MLAQFLRPVALALAIAALSLPAFAEAQHQWVRVTTDNYDNIYRLDKNVAGRGRYRRYWMSVVLTHPDPDSAWVWKKILSSIDCQTFQRRIRSGVWYDRKNKPFNTYAPGGDGQVETVPRKSIEGTIAKIACDLK